MPSVFEEIAAQSPNFEEANPNMSPFQAVALENPQEEGFWKSAFRTAMQIPQGIADVTAYGIGAGLSSLAALDYSELDPYEEASLSQAYQQIGEEFNPQEYQEQRQEALGIIPTISNIASGIEAKTGIPLEPKTRTQKGLRFATAVYRGLPNEGMTFRGMDRPLPKEVLTAGIEGVREGLISAGVNETVADVASLAILKQTQGKAGGVEIGKKRKESGLTERRYESIIEPTEVSPKTLDKINKKVEGEFRDLTDKIIKESPINETYSEIASNPKYKQQTREALTDLETLAETIPGTVSTKELANELGIVAKERKRGGFMPSEYDKRRLQFLQEMMKETPIQDVSASDLLKQYRENNRSYGEIKEPGQSYAYNAAKRDALRDYNIAVEKVIENNFSHTEFPKTFKELNKQWTNIKDAEIISEFLDDTFAGKINFKNAEDLFEKNGMSVPFKRALGEKGFNDFKTLVNDLMSAERGYNMLKTAKGSDYKLMSTLMSYVIHPKLAKAKIGYDILKGGYNKIFDLLLDKPRLTASWRKGINAFKAGNFKVAEEQLNKVRVAEAELEVPSKEIPKQEMVKPTRSETIEPKVTKVQEKKVEFNEIPSNMQQPKLIEYKPSKKPTLQERNTEVAKKIFGESLDGKKITPEQKNVLKKNQVALLTTRKQGQQFHGSSNPIEKLNENIYDTSSLGNMYGAGFYTTDALDIAAGYSKSKARITKPTVYKVTEKTPQKLYDIEQPIKEYINWKDESDRKYFEKMKEYYKDDKSGYSYVKKYKGSFEDYKKQSDYILDEILRDDKPKTLHEFYKEILEYCHNNNVDAFEFQEYLTEIQSLLEGKGYQGISHKGGLLTNNPEHQVKIYWEPQNIEIQEFAYPKEFKKTSKVTTSQIKEKGLNKQFSELPPMKAKPAEKIPETPVESFKTSKGSTYKVNEDGTTTRNKAARKEHGGDSGLQPKSEKTWYVSNSDANKLSEFGAIGAKGEGKSIIELPDNKIGLLYTSGKNKGKVEARTVVPMSKDPKIGMIPVESWESGKKIHFGNEIVQVGKPTEPKPKKITKAEEAHLFGKKTESKEKSPKKPKKEPESSAPEVIGGKNKISKRHSLMKEIIKNRKELEKTKGTTWEIKRKKEEIKDKISRLHREFNSIKPKKEIDVRKYEKPNISKTESVKQKDYIINAIDKALENPPATEMIKIEVPGDGTFKIWNIEDVLKDFKVKVEKNWPTGKLPAKKPPRHRD